MPGIVKGFVLREFRGAPVKKDTLYTQVTEVWTYLKFRLCCGMTALWSGSGLWNVPSTGVLSTGVCPCLLFRITTLVLGPRSSISPPAGVSWLSSWPGDIQRLAGYQESRDLFRIFRRDNCQITTCLCSPGPHIQAPWLQVFLRAAIQVPQALGLNWG